MSTSTIGAVATGAGGGDEYRLPSTVTPDLYELVIKTDLDAPTSNFTGETFIHLHTHADTSQLVFNLGKGLHITHLALMSSDLKTTSAQSLKLDQLQYDEEQERASLDLSGISGGGLKKGGKVKLWMRFEAELSGNMQGYYKSEGDVDEKTGKTPAYALTQFEAIAARRAFPCWDEPLFKAKFALSMISPDHHTVLSNMSEVNAKSWKAATNVTPESVLSDGYELGSLLGLPYGQAGVGSTRTEGKTEGKTDSNSSGTWRITKFDTTPLMSTYLVAYASGVFAHLSSEHKSKGGKIIPLRIFATENLIKQAQFGLDMKKWALPVYEEIFEIPYPLPKLDTLVAHDFDAEAMENWGLITGRTTAYLYDPEKSPLSAKKRVANVQCHELAHMWFGDIVTMKWWDNLWLNEAFATLMGELVIMERIWPEWKPRAEFLNNHLSRALELDSQRSSHPIEMACPDANNIGQIFDGISYSKGASVLRMLAGVVGEQKFLKGVAIYLKKHVYSNAETKDLWAGISEASGLDVAKIMANWTLKTGFPVITVEEKGDGKIKLKQNRFLSTGDVKDDEDETLWWVPLEVKTIKGGKPEVDHKAVLEKKEMEYDFGSAEGFKLNAETVGVYRVNYSPERLVKLGKEASSFSIEDRVGLIGDATTLARAGVGKTSGSLSLVNEMGQTEMDYLPWARISSALTKLKSVWWEQPEPVRKAIDKLRIALFSPVVKKLGWENASSEAPEVHELRELAIGISAAAEDPSTLAEIKKRFEPYLANHDDSHIPPDLQRTIFSNAVKHGGEKEWEKVLATYKKPPNPSTKVDAMYALCATQEEPLLERSLAMLRDGTVKDQDIIIMIMGLVGNVKTKRRIAEWFKEHYDEIIKKFGDNTMINYLAKGCFNTLTSHKDLEMVKAFFKDKDMKKYKMSYSQACDAIQASADWLERDSADVEQWLKDNKYL